MKRFAIPLSAALLTTATAAAGEPGGHGRSGFYIGGGVTYAWHLFEDEVRDATDSAVELDNSYGIDVRAGARVLSFLAIEGEYEYIDGFPGSIEGTEVFDLTGHTLTGNLRLIVPAGPVQPYALAGIGMSRYDISDSLGLGFAFNDTALALRAGAGLELYLSRSFALDGYFGGVLTTHDIEDPTSQESLSGLNYLAARGGIVVRF